MISQWSAIELQREIDRAEYYSEDSGTALLDALKEIDRLRGLLRDIVDICDTDPVTWRESSIADHEKVLTKIDDIAQRYYTK
jgi:hypothetical protein